MRTHVAGLCLVLLVGCTRDENTRANDKLIKENRERMIRQEKAAAKSAKPQKPLKATVEQSSNEWKPLVLEDPKKAKKKEPQFPRVEKIENEDDAPKTEKRTGTFERE